MLSCLFVVLWWQSATNKNQESVPRKKHKLLWIEQHEQEQDSKSYVQLCRVFNKKMIRDRAGGATGRERGRACIPKRLNLKNKWRCSNTNWCMADDSNRTHSKLLSIYDSTNDIDLLESDRTFIARHSLINKHLLRSKSISVILHTNDIDGGRRWHCSMLDFEILKWNIKLPMLTHKLSESRSNVLGELNWPPLHRHMSEPILNTCRQTFSGVIESFVS